MWVLAFSTPSRPGWRWRIVNYDGHMVEESYATFPSIATAVTDGTLRLTKLNHADLGATRRPR